MHFFFSLSLATEPIVAPDDATSQHTATQGFTYDPASGYYYDANTGLYYDSNTGVNEIDFFFFYSVFIEILESWNTGPFFLFGVYWDSQKM